MKGDDPMKEISGTVFNIERFHLHDGAGIRTMVFLKGCLLDCPWCCNPESKSRRRQLGASYKLCVSCSRCVQACPQKALSMTGGKPVVDPQRCILCGQCAEVCLQNVWEIYGKEMTVREVWEAVRGDAAFFRRSGGGVTFSGGEPSLQAEFVEACSALCRQSGMDVNVETCGATSYAQLERTTRHASLILFDIKLLDERFSQMARGLPYTAVTENLHRLCEDGRPVRIRCPIIPGFNDTEDFVDQVIRLALENGVSRVDLLPFHQFGKHKYEALRQSYILKERQPLKESDVEALRQRILAAGLRSVTGG